MISLQINAVPWSLRPAPVYRYMDQRFIDEFFEHGVLRLSSFRRFGEHVDEERLGNGEGSTTISLAAEGRDGGAIQFTVAAPNGYVLSTSALKDKSLCETFGVDGCFRIDNTLGFAAAIARRVPWFSHGLEGPCSYVDRRFLTKREEGILQRMTAPNGKLSADQLMSWTNEIGMPAMLFMKPMKYKHQLEYRFIWHTTRDSATTVDLECPEAVEFCSRTTF